MLGGGECWPVNPSTLLKKYMWGCVAGSGSRILGAASVERQPVAAPCSRRPIREAAPCSAVPSEIDEAAKCSSKTPPKVRF